MSIAAKTRESTASVTRKHKFLGGKRGNQCAKNLDEKVRLQYEKRQEWIRGIREKRLQGIAEGTSSAPGLENASAALFPGRNEYLMTHCGLIEREKRRQILPVLPGNLRKKETRRKEQSGEDRTRVRLK